MAPEEYLYGIYQRFVDAVGHYEIWRWKLSHGACVRPETPLCIPIPEGYQPDTPAFASIGSKLYIIGFGPHILSVKTQRFHTYDLSQIVRTIPSTLHPGVRYRIAAAIGGKIYTFPEQFGLARGLPLSESRFEVFDPATGITKKLLEPPGGDDDEETYVAHKTYLLLGVKQPGWRWIFAFDTAREDGGWKDITVGFANGSLRNPFGCEDWRQRFTAPSHDFDPLPFFGCHLDTLCATALGGGLDDDGDGSVGFFVTTDGCDPFHAIVKLDGDDPFRIKKWCRVVGIPESMLGHSCFAHGGDVFFTFTDDDRPDGSHTSWEFVKFSLAYVSDGVQGYYAQCRP